MLEPVKIPLKAMKGGRVVPHSILDQKGLQVQLGGDCLIIEAPDLPHNREIIKMWRKITEFKDRQIEVGSREDLDYTQLECALHGSALGRLLLNCISIDLKPDVEKQVSKWFAETLREFPPAQAISNGPMNIDSSASEETLRKAFERRWKNLCKASLKHRVAPPDKNALWEKLLKKYKECFKCSYCDQKMLIKDSTPPYSHSFSIDHKTSLFLGGTNAIDNLEIVCHRCNINKSTMRADTFKWLVSVCPPDLMDKMFSEIWAGRIANKLSREEMPA